MCSVRWQSWFWDNRKLLIKYGIGAATWAGFLILQGLKKNKIVKVSFSILYYFDWLLHINVNLFSPQFYMKERSETCQSFWRSSLYLFFIVFFFLSSKPLLNYRGKNTLFRWESWERAPIVNKRERRKDECDHKLEKRGVGAVYIMQFSLSYNFPT